LLALLCIYSWSVGPGEQRRSPSAAANRMDSAEQTQKHGRRESAGTDRHDKNASSAREEGQGTSGELFQF